MNFTYDLVDLDKIVKQVWQNCKHKKVWLFDAPMGSGKTTFINALCKYLNIIELSNSPTFSIINEYTSKQVGTVYHIDLYRLKDEEEAIQCGIEEILNSNHYCFIEWPDKIIEILPNDFVKINISLISENTRNIKIFV